MVTRGELLSLPDNVQFMVKLLRIVWRGQRGVFTLLQLMVALYCPLQTSDVLFHDQDVLLSLLQSS